MVPLVFTEQVMLTHLGFKAIDCLASHLPRHLQYFIAHRVAGLNYFFDRKARRNVQANLRVILGPDAPKSLIRHESRWVFRSFGMYLCEFLGYRKFGPDYIDQHVIVAGREHIDAALKRGRGALFVGAHYSNFEIGATVVAHMGYPITAVVQPHADPRTNAMFVGQRQKAGVCVVPSQTAATAAMKALKQNKTVALLADRATGGPVVPVELFGRRTFLPQGPWRIALASGAPLLPTFAYRRANYGYTLTFGAPIEAPSRGTRDERVAAMAQAWARVLEAHIRRDPAQWAVFYRIWDDPHSGAAGIADSVALAHELSLRNKKPQLVHEAVGAEGDAT
jgi:lauroyl/myristoyl acyltransferase